MLMDNAHFYLQVMIQFIEPIHREHCHLQFVKSCLNPSLASTYFLFSSRSPSAKPTQISLHILTLHPSSLSLSLSLPSSSLLAKNFVKANIFQFSCWSLVVVGGIKAPWGLNWNKKFKLIEFYSFFVPLFWQPIWCWVSRAAFTFL